MSLSGRARRSRTKATVGPLANGPGADPERALVMACIGKLVAGGHADWRVLENGDIRLRLGTGETFLLAETAIVRLA